MTFELPMLNDQDRENSDCTNESEDDYDYFATLVEEIAQAMLDDDEPKDAAAKNAGRNSPPKYWGALIDTEESQVFLIDTEESQIPTLQKISSPHPSVSALHHGSESMHLSAAEMERSMAIDRYSEFRVCSASSTEGQASAPQLHGKWVPSKARSIQDASFVYSNSLQKSRNPSGKSPSQRRGKDLYLSAFEQVHPMDQCKSLKLDQRGRREMISRFNSYQAHAAPLPVPYWHHPLSMDALQFGMTAAFSSCAPTIGTGVFLPRTGSNYDRSVDCGVKMPRTTQSPRQAEAKYYHLCGYLCDTSVPCSCML